MEHRNLQRRLGIGSCNNTPAASRNDNHGFGSHDPESKFHGDRRTTARTGHMAGMDEVGMGLMFHYFDISNLQKEISDLQTIQKQRNGRWVIPLQT
jgi:hypothetical protein